MVQQVKRQTEALEQHQLSVPPPPLRLNVPRLDSKSSAVYLSAEQIAVADRLVPVSLQLRGGDKVLVTGPNGASKSTLLRVLAGALALDQGNVHRRTGARISLVGQENPAWTASHSAREVFEAHVAALVSSRSISPGDAVFLSGLGLLPSEALRIPVADLSQGQQRRLELAMRLAKRPHVLLLLDEPSNHLAMQLVDELTEALLVTKAAVVVATHDRHMIADLGGFRRITLLGAPAAGVR